MASNSHKTFADTNLLVRTVMENAINDNNWTSADYAKKVGISTVKVMSLRKGLIMIDSLTVGELMKIGRFHKIDFIF